MGELENKFIKIIESDKELIEVLKIVRDINLPDVFVGAGAIRNLVWDVLHNYSKRTPVKDIDVAYFDSLDISPEKDLEIYKELSRVNTNFKWNVFNQARSHIKNSLKTPANSTKEGISHWIEIPTCTGVRLNRDNSFSVCAPYGLYDLMNLIVRPIPGVNRKMDVYKKRIQEKKWKENWPKLKIFYD